MTIDLDSPSLFRLGMCIFKGMVLTRKLPYKVKRSPSKQGFHLIWHDVPIDWETCLKYRRIMKDDFRRIRFDMMYSEKRMATQILFNKKIYKVRTPEGTFTFNQLQKEEANEKFKEYQERIIAQPP